MEVCEMIQLQILSDAYACSQSLKFSAALVVIHLIAISWYHRVQSLDTYQIYDECAINLKCCCH